MASFKLGKVIKKYIKLVKITPARIFFLDLL